MRPLLLISLAVFVSACAHDRRRDVAYGLLYRDDGIEQADAFEAAFRARFPPDAPLGGLQSFFAAHDGRCWQPDAEHVSCELPTRAQQCAARLVKVEAEVHEARIGTLTVHIGGVGC
jgi:hypothetical protein